jgi:hypothetical protein
MSRINILATFKIRSLTDSYFMVGTSETGDFTRDLGTGERLYTGDIDPLLKKVGGIPVDDGKTLDETYVESGLVVSVPVSLGEEYGDFMIRLYAENELGIRSPFIELEKNILPADISGTFRFQSLDVRDIESEKPGYRASVRRRAKKTSNLYIKEHEFVSASFQLQFSLKANARLAGNKAGSVSSDNPMFSHFNVEFYTSWDGTTVNDSGLVGKLNVPDDWLYSQEKLENYTDFSIYLNKESIISLYRYNNITDQDRRIIVKIVGYDIFYNIDLDANGDEKDDHKFSAIAILENDKPFLESATFELYGQSMEVEVQASDPDLDHGQIKLLKYRSDASGGAYSLVSSERLLIRQVSTSLQEWHSATHSNYYKYIIELHDAYGFGSYFAVNNGRIKKSGTSHEEFDTPELALDSTQVWSSYLEIQNLEIKESGSTLGENKGSFQISWEVKDSVGNTVDITKDLDGNVAYKIKTDYTVNTIEGFTACFICPDDYSDAASSFPVRDARDLSHLIPSEADPALAIINGEPADAGGGSSTIDKPGVVLKAENKLQISSENSFILTKEQSEHLYRSWFNDHNRNQRRAVDMSFDKSVHDPFRVVYNASYGSDVTPHNLDSKERHVDAQRRVKLRVELINKNNVTTHLVEETGYNSPPVFQLGGGTQSLNDQGNSKNDNTDGGSNHSAVRVHAGNVHFELPPNERIQYIEIFRRPHVEPDLSGDPVTCYSEVYQDNSNPQQGGHFYNKQSTDFFVDQDLTANSEEMMLFNYGINPTNGEQQYGGGDGFYVRRVSSLGNTSKQPIVNGINIGVTENNSSYQDFPPMLCENGFAQDTEYDYMIIPFDLFGSGQAELFEGVTPVSPHRYSQDERGAIGTLDFDAPSEPVDLKITGANKTFQLNWTPPVGTTDLDYYNLYYILDNRDHTQMFWNLVGSDPISKSASEEEIINFNTEGYSYQESDFLEQDFDFKNALDVSWPYWVAGQPYGSGDLVQFKPTILGTNKSGTRLYRALESVTDESPNDTPAKWALLPNATIYDDRNIIYKDDIIDRVRTDTVLNNGTGSHTYNLIYYSVVKSYSVNDVVFLGSRCFKSKTTSNAGNAPSAVGDTTHWKLIPNVEIVEVQVPSTETSISVQGDSNARGYFYLESVDRAGNRSRLHANPVNPDSSQVKKDLGKPAIRDIENFEQDLSSEFPHALMLRPDNPFSFREDGADVYLKWHGHYLYSAGQGYYIDSGEMSVQHELFAANLARYKDASGADISPTQLTDDQHVRYIYFDRAYGYDTNHSVSPRFSRHNAFDEGITIRDIESDLGHGSDSSDSGIEEKDRDTGIQYSGYYLFCTGNPASNTYNALETDGTEVIDSEATDIDNLGDLIDGPRIGLLNDILNDFDGDSTTNSSGTKRIVPQGDEPTSATGPNPNGLGTWGLHVQKSEKIQTDSSRSLFRKDSRNPGTFQIARIDRTPNGTKLSGYDYFVEVNFETFNNATIGQANIANATITSAQVADLGADKITAGVIGSHKIEIGNSIKPSRNGGVLSDSQKYMYEKKDTTKNFDISNGDPYITQQAFNELGVSEKLLFQPMLEQVYEDGFKPFSVVGSQYEYGSITSKGFGHDTMGVPGFFISGDGQFGFQTTRGGLYLRDDGTGTPAELVLRGTLVQESADPFVKIEMSTTSQFVSFDEHAGNHYYTSNKDIYGTRTQLISPSDGRITVEYSIQNARHVDGSPYTASELELRIYVDGDVSKTLAGSDVARLVGNQTYAHERKEWASGSSYVAGDIVKHNNLSYKALVNDSSTEPGTNPGIWKQSAHYQSHDQYISKNAHDSLTVEEQQAYDAYGPISNDAIGIMGLNDLSDINAGGSITLDFLGGGTPIPEVDSLNNQLILFTGKPITDATDNSNDVERDTLEEIKDDLEELDLLDPNEALPSSLIPMADSYTVEFMIKPRTPAYDSNRTYLAGDLAKYNGAVFRSINVHSGAELINQAPSIDITAELQAMIDSWNSSLGEYSITQGDYWRIIPEEFSLDRKKITITRKDKPANLASIILTSDEGSIIRNGDDSTAIINIYPKLKYGTEEHDLNVQSIGLDWVESMREQLAIYEGPPTVEGDPNNPQETHFMLRRQWGDYVHSVNGAVITSSQWGALPNADPGDGSDWQGNYPLQFTYSVSDSVVDGKSTFFLVDRKFDYGFPGTITIDNWDAAITAENIKILDEFEVVDLHDGKANILVETVDSDDQFITRLLDTRFAADTGSSLDYADRHQLQPIISRVIPCKLSLFAPTGEGTSLNTYTHLFNLVISNVLRGNYIQGSNVSIVSTDASPVGYAIDPHEGSSASGNIFEITDPNGKVVGKARLDLDFDNSDHVSEIKILTKVLQTYNTTGDAVDKDSVKWSGVVDGNSLFDGSTEVYINTAEPIDHAIRLNLLRKMITWSRYYEETGVGDLDRAENIVPMQIFLGTENVSDEFHADATTSSNISFELIPSEGFVVDEKFLNGDPDGECYPKTRKTDARNLIDRYTVGAPKTLSAATGANPTERELIYYSGLKWHFLQDVDSGNDYVDTSSGAGKDYMYYIPVSQKTIGADRIKIKTTYTKLSQPLARIDSGAANPGGTVGRTYIDTEELPVVEINNGSSTVTLFTDNLNTEIPITSDSATEVIVSVEALTSTIEAYIGLNKACLAPSYLTIDGHNFDYDGSGDQIKWVVTPNAISNYDGKQIDFYYHDYNNGKYVRDGGPSAYGSSMQTTVEKRTDGDMSNVSDQDVKYVTISLPSDSDPTLAPGFKLALFNAGDQLLAWADMPAPMTYGIFVADTVPVISGIKRYTTQEAGEGSQAGVNLTSVLGLVNASPPLAQNADIHKVTHKILYDYADETGDPASPGDYDAGHLDRDIQAALTFFKPTTQGVNPVKYFDEESQVSIPIGVVVYDTRDYWKTEGGQAETVNRVISARKSGPTGATTTYRGTWKVDETYFGTKERRDIVYYNAKYWLAKEGAEEFAFGQDIPTRRLNDSYGLGFTKAIYDLTYPTGTTENTSGNDSFTPGDNSRIWERFGIHFQQVATNLLLADDVFVKRGIVTGIDDPYQGFIASQLDQTGYTPGAGGVKVDLNSSLGTNYPVTANVEQYDENGNLVSDGKYSVSHNGIKHYFADSILNNNDAIQAVYQNVLGRSADVSGLAFWLTQNFTVYQMIYRMIDGPSQNQNDPAHEYQNNVANGDNLPDPRKNYNDRDANANEPEMRNITSVTVGNTQHTLEYYIDPNDPNNTDKFSSTPTPVATQAKPHVTTWTIPYAREPGYFLGYHPTKLCPDGVFSNLTYADGSKYVAPPALPMFELYSPMGNYLRWNGLRLEMFGSVINGSINDSGTISIGVGTDHALNHVSFSNEKLIGGQIFCGGGVANYITDTKSNLCSTITGGAHNSLFGKFSFIGSGYGNYILDNDFSFIGSGFANAILNTDSKPDSFNAILTGRANKIVNSDHSAILTGFGNVISKSDYGSIINGQSNFIGSGNVNFNNWKSVGTGSSENYPMTSSSHQSPAAPWWSEVVVDLSRDYRRKLLAAGVMDQWTAGDFAWFENTFGNNGGYTTLKGFSSDLYSQMLSEMFGGACRASLTFPKSNYLTHWSTQQTNGEYEDVYWEAGDHPYANLNPFIALTMPCDRNSLPLTVKHSNDVSAPHSGAFKCESFKIQGKDMYLIPLYGHKHAYWLGEVPVDRINTEAHNLGGELPPNSNYINRTDSSLVGHVLWIDRNFFPWIYVYAGSGKGIWMLLQSGLDDNLRVVTLKSVSEAYYSSSSDLSWGDAALGAATLPDAFVIAANMINGGAVGGHTWPADKNTTKLASLDLSSSGGEDMWATGKTTESSRNLSEMRRMLEFVELGDSDESSQLFSYNSIVGGKRNSLHNSKNSLIIASTSTSGYGLKNAVLGGAGNIINNKQGGSDCLYSSVSTLGSKNKICWDNSGAGNEEAQLTVMGSDNIIFNTTSSVFLGNANRVIGASEKTNSAYSNPGDVVALNVFGNNNELVGNYSANTCAIFGSNFKLTTVEQMQNAFYFGNPYLAGSSTDSLTRLFFAADGGAYFTGDVISFALSDKKYKKNISVISEPMRKVNELRGVSFDWRDNQNVYSGRDVGLIAQEVEKVLPEVVSERESGDKAVKYEKIVPLLVECIKALSQKVVSLESAVDELEKNS